MIQQAKFTYSPLRKAFGKQTKTIAEEGKKNKKKQLKIMENNWLNLMHLLAGLILISAERVYHLKNKEVFQEPLNKKAHEYDVLRDKINPNKLI